MLKPCTDAAEEHDKKIPVAEKALTRKTRRAKESYGSGKTGRQNRKRDAEGLLAAITSRQSATKDEASTTDSAVADTSEQDEARSSLDQALAELGEATTSVATLKDEVVKLDTSGVEELKKNRPPRPRYAMSVRDRAKPADTKLAIRGDFPQHAAKWSPVDF